MAPQQEKKKHNKNKQDTSRSSKQLPWDPDLPPQLIHLMKLLPWHESSSAFLDIYFKGVTKTIRAQSSKCSSKSSNPTPPWLQLRLDDNDYDERSVKGWIPHSLGSLSSGSFDAFDSNKDLTLCVFLSGSPCDTECIALALTGLTHPAFAYDKKCEHGTSIWFCYKCEEERKPKKWIKQDCTIVDPHCSNPSDQHHFMRFTNGIAFNEKFYVLSLQGTLAVIEPIDSQLRITATSKKRAIPSVLPLHFRECLLESNGKILLVFLISRKSTNIVDDVEVFWLDIEKLGWIKMKNLGDSTLFLGSNCCTSFIASQVGSPKNCVYFKHSSDDCSWWVFDLQRGEVCSSEKYPIWDEPKMMLRKKKLLNSLNVRAVD